MKILVKISVDWWLKKWNHELLFTNILFNLGYWYDT